MSFIFILIVAVLLSIAMISLHFHGWGSEGAQIVVVACILGIAGAGLIPYYHYDGDTSVLASKVYKTEIGYFSMVDGILYCLTDADIVLKTDPNVIKMVDRKTKCGFGWYVTSNYHLVDINDPEWKERISKGIDIQKNVPHSK